MEEPAKDVGEARLTLSKGTGREEIGPEAGEQAGTEARLRDSANSASETRGAARAVETAGEVEEPGEAEGGRVAEQFER